MRLRSLAVLSAAVVACARAPAPKPAGSSADAAPADYFPLAIGNRWSSIVSASSTERYEIAAVGETATTPAGAFSGCVRVRAHNRAAEGAEHVLEITYAPGVGPVKLETFAVVGDAVTPQVRALLRAYRVGGK